MSPTRIQKRLTSKGEPRWSVVYRRGGRGFKDEWAGSFTTLKEARLRRDWVAGLLAAGHNPAAALAELKQPARRRTLIETFDAWQASRHDVGAQTGKAYDQARRLLAQFFNPDPPVDSITVQDCREYMGWLARRYAASSVHTYWYPFAQTLDFAELEPNPARHRTIRKPTVRQAEPVVMPLAHFQAIIQNAPERWRLFLRLLEATGMRVDELHKLTWGDVAIADSRFRVSTMRTKGGYGQRWVQVPAPLMEAVAGLLPFDDRTPDRKVFRLPSTDACRAMMLRACQAAGVPHYSPHDLRHRRLSLWHFQGVPARELADRAGHAKVAMTLERYSHVVVGDPWAEDPWASGPDGGEE